MSLFMHSWHRGSDETAQPHHTKGGLVWLLCLLLSGPIAISQEEMPLEHYPVHFVSWVLLWGALPSPCCLWQGKMLLLLPWISVRAVEHL